MEKRNRGGLWGARLRVGFAPFRFLAFLLFASVPVSLVLTGCAAPGEPIERRAPVPTPISDLAAVQRGSDVILTFTLPRQTVQKLPLKSLPAVEIYRDFSPPGSASENFSLVATIPPSQLSQYTEQGHVRYPDPLPARDFAGNPGTDAVYSVRTRAAEKKESENSNLVAVPLAVPPKPISDAKAQVTHNAILLSWTVPSAIITGAPANILGFRIYRAELETPPGSASAGLRERKSALAQVGETDSSTTSFADIHFVFGATYEYSIRSVFPAGKETSESDDSNLVDVMPRDVFPPAAPQGLEVIFVPAQAGAPASLDLSWAISPETDVVGYNVYRSEQEGARGGRLNAALLRTPAFRDMNAVPGRRYFYTVTAVDTAGLESAASAAVLGGVPQSSH